MVDRERDGSAADEVVSAIGAPKLGANEAADRTRVVVPSSAIGSAMFRTGPLNGHLGIPNRAGRESDESTPRWAEALRSSWAEAAEERRAQAPPVEDASSLEVFNDVLVGTTSVTTVATFDEVLAAEDQLAIEAVVAQVTSSGGGPVSLTVAIEHASDRRNF